MNSASLTLPDLGWSNAFQAQLDLGEIGAAEPVRVTEVQRDRASVLGLGGAAVIATGKLPPLAVGDWVLMGHGERPPRLLDRLSAISRKSAGTAHSVQLIASNVTTIFIVSSCNADFNIGRLERYLVLARQSGVMPVLVLTKADECADPGLYRDQAQELDRTLVVETVDARSAEASGRLTPWCGRGETVVLAGSSGVGKSTLANLLAGTDLAVQGIREDDARGRHTTTARSMHRLLAGGWLIDTPGMRELKLAEAGEGIEAVFADILALAADCRFRNCSHEGEPGCAVQAAIVSGDLQERRLESWRKLAREDRFNTETLAEAHARNRAFGKMTRKVGAHKEMGKWGR
jgi:ribosome biogenesis GTPase / thiamine phosphate phosphatase